MRLRASLIVAALTCASLVGLAAASSAHDDSVYYPSWWQSDLSVDWRFASAVPNTWLRDRFRDAAQTWNGEPPVMRFNKLSGDYSSFSADSCPNEYQKNAIHWGSIDGEHGTYAWAKTCEIVSSSEIWTFQIKVDKAEDWYNGTSTPAPSGRLDSQAVATHEFGHATGFDGPYQNGHFNDDGAVCTSKPYQTMCPFFSYGKSYTRSLESHDEHTFYNQYP